MYVTGLHKVEKNVVTMEGAKGVQKQIPLSRKDGVPASSFRVFTIGPGGHTPFHRHDYEHMNYVIAGEGIVVGDDREQKVREGDFALILPGEKHQYRNTAKTGNLVIICAVPKEYE
jgi:quercetin dioxygenase-like cupin family protein